MTGFVAVIPARYASSRLPGKPLLDIAGVPMVVRVARQAQASGAARTVVATDDARIAAAVRDAGIEVVQPPGDHPSGTDRIAAAAAMLGLAADDIVVNVQGDEPVIDPACIRRVADMLASCPDAAMATLCHPIHGSAALLNPNFVKVVLDRAGYALYFSRAPIPYARDALAAGLEPPPELPALRHIGLYSYRVEFLARYAALEPAPIERFEALEQLRVMWHGYRIACAVVDEAPEGGVDTPEDLGRVRALFDRAGDSR